MSNCCTCSPTYDLKVGDNVHSRAVNERGVRRGGAETHTITYVSDFWVGVDIFSRVGELLTEKMFSRESFEENFEKCH